MKFPRPNFQRLNFALKPVAPDPAQQLFRLKAVERDIVLPIKALYIGILIYFLYYSKWYSDLGTAREIAEMMVDRFFIIYGVINVGAAAFLLIKRRINLARAQRVVFSVSLLDSFFLAALTVVTGGFDSILYWLFPGLIVRNAVTHPGAKPQIILNLTVVFSFVLAGALDELTMRYDATLFELPPELPTEPILLRTVVLLLFAITCYGLQVLFERARLVAEESREFVTRQEQLRAAGRLAAEIAHQVKNPLGIINNAAFALQRATAAGKPMPMEQLEIIREEVARSDRIITELMGYAQLAEGTVERLNLVEEINRAINVVFPGGVYRGIQVKTDYGSDLPPLLMQRRHFSEIIVNILQNAREALGGNGQIEVSAEVRDHFVRIEIADDGPGIPPEKTQKIFEAYFSTKEKGTGLGLSIVRHNVDIYSGTVRVESELGQGSRFILELPTRTFMRLRK
ncbi:MAG TPA: ATP-binding protein [Candidatus Acidoferrum sp.]|nr:ATP-binding protein [Candidatus Acidoferrum sp.]